MSRIVNEKRQNWFYRILIFLRLRKRQYYKYTVSIGGVELGSTTGVVTINESPNFVDVQEDNT